mmetsp:Transcript_8766/g.11638  ORF Transcript_8766/g.11638 Transcript_8766/m.11638 type:complete len:417 (+) Transcript_8766:119-1369(+)
MIGYADRTAGAVEHCEAMATSTGGPVAEAYGQMAEFCKSKLWHQLTMLVLQMLQAPEKYATTFEGTHSFLALYDKVVLTVDTKLNPLSLAKIAALVAQAIQPQDVTAAKAVLENLLEKNKETKEKGEEESGFFVPANIYVQSKMASLVITTSPEGADLSATVSIMKANKVLLHEFPAEGNSELASVHAAHYESAMQYSKRVGPPEAFYEHALSYLQHKPNFGKEGDLAQALELAVDLIIAALTGDGVYNLGQVEQTPVLKLLLDTPQAWLVHLLQATAAGDVQRFRQCEQEYAAQIAQQPALVHRATAVTEKLTLLALVTLVFSKPSHERQLSFDEIAAALVLSDVDQVEWIVMRALSVHLMEGSIDQVEQSVDVTWVMPRVLSQEQMQHLATRFGEWATRVSTTQDSMALSEVLA